MESRFRRLRRLKDLNVNDSRGITGKTLRPSWQSRGGGRRRCSGDRNDGGYTGESFAKWVKGLRPKLVVTVVKRSDSTVGFKVLPRRWIVERTFGWLMRQRRLVRDYETTAASAEAWIYIAMIRIQLRRLA